MNHERSSRCEQIFHSAAEITDPLQRQEYLDQACAGDAELREEVENLLQHDRDAGSFLDHAPSEMPPTVESGDAGPSEADDEQWRDLLQPTDKTNRAGLLSHYEVMESIGRGGFGIVLRAFDAKLNRIVAIKLLSPSLSSNAMAVRRFLREAQAAAAISHEHVVRIYAIDEDHRPPFIVMEMIEGLSLQQKIDRIGALDVPSILRIGMQVAAGLSAAHRQGLVHRDVKPANILLENGIKRVKLTDFGLARAVDDIRLTQTGQISGTPQYMSPEQAQGQVVDHRTDLFSLGCVMYAMCTGQAAFRADSAVAVMHRIVHDTPRPIREANADIPDWMCDIVDKLLEKNPDDRFRSADEVEDLLGGHLAHLQQPDSVPQPARVERQGSAAISMRQRMTRWNVIGLIPLSLRIAGLLFAAVYILAAADRAQLFPRRIVELSGVFFYLLATGFVIGWGMAAIIRRRKSGEMREDVRRVRVLSIVLGIVTLSTGIFVAAWTNFDFRDPVGYGDRILAVLWGDDIAPWDDFRWRDQTAYAQIDGLWYDVGGIQNKYLYQVLRTAERDSATPKRRIVENLVDVLLDMQEYSGRYVTLKLRDLRRTDELIFVETRIEMTKARHETLMKNMYPNGLSDDAAPVMETAEQPVDLIRNAASSTSAEASGQE